MNYRSTCEKLKREKHLWIARAGPYAGAEHPDQLLAERIESVIYESKAATRDACIVVDKHIGNQRESILDLYVLIHGLKETLLLTKIIMICKLLSKILKSSVHKRCI